MRPSSQSMKPRRDGGEDAIIETFEALGWSVVKSPPLDLIIGKRDRTVLIEVKDGSKTPSGQKLTKAEVKFIKGWRGEVYIVRSAEDARTVNAYWEQGGPSRLKEMRDEIREIQEGR